MSILNELTEMKSKGFSEEEIIRIFKERGVSPKEIEDSFSQAKIKSAVFDREDYQPTIGQNYQEENYPAQEYQKESLQEEYSPQEYSQQGDYEGYSSAGTDTETIIEIAEQVFKEKTQVIQKQLESTNEFKVLLKSTVDNLSERIKKLENIIDKLQIAILEKVGSYGENLESIKKEMGMMQDSFGKMVGNIAEKKIQREPNEIPEEKKQIKRQSRKL